MIGKIRLIEWLTGVVILVFTPLTVTAQLPESGVIFDDFEYSSTEWCSEVSNPSTCTHPPVGSLYGDNIWYSASGSQWNRAWYKWLWQEQTNHNEATHILVEPEHNGKLSFVIKNGVHPGDGDGGNVPRQIVSGFTAKRGVWAARVNFGNMEPASRASLIQAFWLKSLMDGFSNKNGKKEWNEFDFEWFNDASSSSSQFFLRTGHTVGSGGVEWPLFSPAWPDNDPDPREGTIYTWNCKYIWGDQEVVERLENDDCVKVLNQGYVDSQNNSPLHDPWIILVLRITDTGVFYDVLSFGWGGIIVAHSQIFREVPELPMAALFSQHINRMSTLDEDEVFEVDWFYFTPDTTVNINDVEADVRYLRSTVDRPRYNSTGLDLERPYAHLPGVIADTSRTSRLSLDISSFPDSMNYGESTRLLALPPNRSGTVSYSWKRRDHYKSGPPSSWSSLDYERGGWEYTFTFPSRIDINKVEIKIKLDELFYAHPDSIISNRFIQPLVITKTIWKSGK